MKIAIGEFHQETNSFNPFVSTRKDYEVFGIQKGSEVISCVDDSCALQGMINTLKAEAVQILPTCRMWANAWGRVEDKVVEEFLEEVASVLKDHLPLDGVC